MLATEEIGFRPRYDRRYKVGVALLVMLILGALVLLLPEADAWSAGVIAFLAIVAVRRLPYNLLAEIHFGERITLRHAFLPERTYAYADVRDVSPSGFLLRRAKVGWERMENSEALIATIDGLIERGVIPEEQLEGKLAVREYSSAVAGAIGSLVALVVLAGLIVLGIRFPYFMPGDFFVLTVMLVCYGIVYLIHRTLIAE